MITISTRLGLLTSYTRSRHTPSSFLRRTKVTSSIEPPPVLLNGYVESPGVIALMESSLYRDAWSKSFASTFPHRGIHFLSVDVFSDLSSSVTVSESFAQMHAELATDLSPHAEVTLVARGPLPCLVAQYYLESLPLSGMILVDPLIVPRRGGELNRNKYGDGDNESLQSSAQSFLQTISQAHCFDFETNNENDEIMLLGKMQQSGEYNRPLKLESGIIPVKVVYTGGDNISHEGKFRSCAERTASYHAPANDDNNNIYGEIAIEKLERGLDSAMETIYSFHDEII